MWRICMRYFKGGDIMYKWCIKGKKYIGEYDGEKLMNIWKIVKRHLCVIDKRDGYNFELCYSINVKTNEECWFKVVWYTSTKYEIILADNNGTVILISVIKILIIKK